MTINDVAVLIYRNIMELARLNDRIDIVCDRYFKDSLKDQTRKQRGVGTRFIFTDETPFPKDFRKDFLHNSENKNALNEYLAEKFVSLHNTHQILIVTYKCGVLCSNSNIDPSRAVFYCTSEEADQRIVRHARDALLQGFKRVLVWTIDTDVLVLLIAFATSPNADDSNIYAAMCSTDRTVSYYNVKEIQSNLGFVVKKALPFFYAFTGCDTVSSIFSQRKCKC